MIAPSTWLGRGGRGWLAVWSCVLGASKQKMDQEPSDRILQRTSRQFAAIAFSGENIQRCRLSFPYLSLRYQIDKITNYRTITLTTFNMLVLLKIPC